MTIDVTDQFVVHSGQSFAFTDEIGFQLQGDAAPTLINKGAISLTVADVGPDIFPAILAYPASDAFLWNREGGGVAVQAADDVASAVAIDLEGPSARLRNDGDITLHGAQTAYAVLAQGADFKLGNRGVIEAVSPHLAIGAFVRDGATVRNSGSITAEGVAGASAIYALGNGDAHSKLINSGLIQATGWRAVGIELIGDYQGYDIGNGGRIVARATDGGGSIGILTQGGSGVGVTQLDNSGLIRGDVALASSAGDTETWTLNSGKMVGGIEFAGSGIDRIFNTGAIHGDVDLGEGDDTYNGAGGRLDGSVKGGAGADALTGGKGADSFRYDHLADSAVGSSDLIQNLQKIDVIDLSRIDADATTDGQQHLTAGQVTLTFDSGSGNTWLDVDTGGADGPEMRIVIVGDHTDFTGVVL